MSRLKPLRVRAIAFVVLALTIACWSQRGVLTSPRNLTQLTDSAATIVRGRIITARVQPHPSYPHLSTVVVMMRAEEVLKGAPENTFTFRQFIFDIRDRRTAAGYRKGDEYLLLMNPPSRLGLTSPVGQEQGRFRIIYTRDGKAFAINGHGNRGLFEGAEAQPRFKAMSKPLAAIASQHRSGPIELNDLRSMIRQLSVHQ